MNTASGIFDGLLVLHYRGGDQKAMGMLVHRYHARLCRHAYFYTRDTEVSRDIVQESWRQILKSIGSLQDPNKFGSWAMTIVTRKSLDYLNRKKRERKFLDQELRADTAVEEQTSTETEFLHMRLRKAIKELDRKQQEVLRLFYAEGFSLLEIGRILGVPPGTVKSRLFHARENLKSIIK